MTTGEQLRKEGMRAAMSADERWRAAAHEVMDTLVASGRPFSANDFQNLMGHRHTPDNAGSVGSLFGSYAKRGKIVRHGTTRAAKPSSHARLYPTWIATEAQFDTTERLDRTLRALSDALGRITHADALAQAGAEGVREGERVAYARGIRLCLDILNEEIDRPR